MEMTLPRHPEERWIKIHYASILSLVPNQEIKNWVKRDFLDDWQTSDVNGASKWLFSFVDIARLAIIKRLTQRIPLLSLSVASEVSKLCMERFLSLYDPQKGYPWKEYHVSKFIFSLKDDGSLAHALIDHEEAQDLWGGILNFSDKSNEIDLFDDVCFFVFGVDGFFSSQWNTYCSMLNALEASLADSTPYRGYRARKNRPEPV